MNKNIILLPFAIFISIAVSILLFLQYQKACYERDLAISDVTAINFQKHAAVYSLLENKEQDKVKKLLESFLYSDLTVLDHYKILEKKRNQETFCKSLRSLKKSEIQQKNNETYGRLIKNCPEPE